MEERENNTGYIESPFRWQTGMNYEEQKPEHTISLPAYLKMYNKGVFKMEDLMVIFNLYRLGYSTRNALSHLVTSNDCLKGSLKKLVKHGIVIRCYLSFEQEQYKYRTVHFYKLSSIGMQIAKAQKESGGVSLTKTLLNTLKNSPGSVVAPLEILKCLALNTFIASIAFDSYDRYIERMITNYHIQTNNREILLKVLYELKNDDEFSRTLIIPLVARRNNKWEKELIYLLTNINSNLKKNFKGYDLVYIIVVEDNIMACNAAKSINGTSALSSCAIMYVSDWTVNNGAILENLLNVNAPRCDSYSIVKLAI